MEKRLSEFFPDAAVGNGIFKAISKYKWFEGIIPEQVDVYFYLTAGDKIGMKFLDRYVDSEGHITGTNLDKIAMLCLNLNYNSWKHEYKALTVEYNPIENTDFVELIKDKDHITTSGKMTNSNEQTTTGSFDNENVTTGSMKVSGDSSVYAFDSTDPVPSAESESTTDYDAGTDPVTVTNTTNYGTENDNPLTVKNTTTTDYGSLDDDPVTIDKAYEREYRKHGNIGVTTNAQMIMSDIEVWKLNKFYDILIADICKVIALSIY